MAQLQDWLMFSSADLHDAQWDFVNDVPRNAGRRQLPLKLRPTAAAEDSRRRACAEES